LAKSIIPTTLALAKEELVHPLKLLQTDPQTLTEVIYQASNGKLGAPRAEAILRSARQTFYMPYAPEAQSFNLKLMAQAHEYIIDHLLPPLQARIQECLTQIPFPQYLTEIPYFGPIVTATFLAELGWPFWFRTVDSVVAWFGLDPSVSESADHATGISRLTKRGTKYGRRIMWLVATGAASSPKEIVCFERSATKTSCPTTALSVSSLPSWCVSPSLWHATALTLICPRPFRAE
jgi:hypothetical protein